jgi:Leucine-rich repeat (LRR) protein
MMATLGVLPLSADAVPVPTGIGRLPPRLVRLGLAFNAIEALPASFVVSLPALEELDVSYNR